MLKIILFVVVVFFIWHIATSITHKQNTDDQHQTVTSEIDKLNTKMLKMEGAVK